MRRERKIKNILTKKFYNQRWYRSGNKSSPENICHCDKPRPVFHKDMIGEIVCAVCKESEQCSSEKYFWDRSSALHCRNNNKVHHTANIDRVEEKCRDNCYLTGCEMREILCVPFWSKESNPQSIDSQKEYKCRNKNKKYFEHNNIYGIWSIL